MTRIITVTSGKGGVGKTNLSANLSLHLAALGHPTCIFDADLGLANINILLGLYPEHTIEDVILHEKPLSDVIIKDYQGIDIIPGSSGVEKIANIEPDQIENLIKPFSILDNYEFLIFDTSAGVSRNVVSFCLASSEVIIVITPEPTSMTDAYALLKILCINGLESPVKVVVNQCKNTASAKQTYSKFKEVVKKYLFINIQPLGVILEDHQIINAVKKQQPFISLFPAAIASKCIKAIAKNLLENNITDVSKAYDIGSFWKRYIELFKGRLNLEGIQKDKKEAKPEKPIQALPIEQTGPISSSEPVIPVEKPETRLSVDSIKPAEQPEHNPETVEELEEQKELTRTEKSSTPFIADKVVKDNGASETPHPVDQGFYPLLDKLVNSISSISEEVKCLRKAVEGNGKDVLSSNLSANPNPATEGLKPIRLDFDKFIQKHKKVKR